MRPKKTTATERHYYFTFSSTYQAIKAEKALGGKKWPFKMLPVPRRISTSCGTALRCFPTDAPEIKVVLQNSGVQIEGEYALTDEELRKKT